MELINAIMNSVVSDNARMAIVEIRDFKLGIDIPPGNKEYLWIDGVHFTQELIARHLFQPYAMPFHSSFRMKSKLEKKYKD